MGASMYAWFTRGALESEGSSITWVTAFSSSGHPRPPRAVSIASTSAEITPMLRFLKRMLRPIATAPIIHGAQSLGFFPMSPKNGITNMRTKTAEGPETDLESGVPAQPITP